jgi:hypothetical protein
VSVPRGIINDMNLRQDARHLKAKSISSMRSAMAAFNSPDDDGRVTRVLLHLQHAFEMLLKAALVQDRMQVFDKRPDGRSGSSAASTRPGSPTRSS